MTASTKMKRVLVVSDMHCGHLVGLTPPSWQIKASRTDSRRSKISRVQRDLWGHYKSRLSAVSESHPIDRCLYLGDGIDGDGGRSGGSELICSCPEDQVDMAVECLDQIRLHASSDYKIVGVFGTPYHTGQEMDHENAMAYKAGFEKIGSHEWVDINGCVFDIKHKVGGSGIPHGRYTSIAKEKLWSDQWAAKELQPKADVILRGHVHYHGHCGGPGWLAMTLPALQGMGSKFGARQCSGLVDWGFVVFDVFEDGSYDWEAHTVIVNSQKTKAVIL